jgi:hypothetical protein
MTIISAKQDQLDINMRYVPLKDSGDGVPECIRELFGKFSFDIPNSKVNLTQWRKEMFVAIFREPFVGVKAYFIAARSRIAFKAANRAGAGVGRRTASQLETTGSCHEGSDTIL